MKSAILLCLRSRRFERFVALDRRFLDQMMTHPSWSTSSQVAAPQRTSHRPDAPHSTHQTAESLCTAQPPCRSVPKLASTGRFRRLPSSSPPRFHRHPEADGRSSLSLHGRSSAVVALFFTTGKAFIPAPDELAARGPLSCLILRAVSTRGRCGAPSSLQTNASRVVGAQL